MSRWKDMTPEELQREVNRRTWFHSIDLGRGVITPGQKDTIAEVDVMQIPVDLSGLSVLDVGAYDGFYSFECERRGAEHVVAADDWAWNWPGSDARANFELAREVLGSSVRDVTVSVEDLCPEAIGGQFDVVLFLGVLYHAPEPLTYLKRVHSVTRHYAIIETVVDMLDIDVPAAAYYPADSLNGDGSNHFGPNPLAMHGLLTDAGFSHIESFAPWQTRKDYAIVDARRGSSPVGLSERLRRKIRRHTRSGRMVFKAYA